MFKLIRKILKINNEKKYLILEKKLEELTNYEITKVLTNLDTKNLEIKEIFNLLNDLLGTSIVEGLHIIENIFMTQNIEGDICEFGVAQGKTSKLLAYLIKSSNKNLYLFDSFEGLPNPTSKDELKDDIFNLGSIKSYKGKMAHKKYKVVNELEKIGFMKNRYFINEGYFIKDNLDKFKFPDKISFAYIDFDFYQPTIDVLNTIQDKLTLNSRIIVDDYDYFSTGVKHAVDEWIEHCKLELKVNKIKTNLSSFIIINRYG